MLRGTLMVLKRLLMTALGALSLGALATGPVSAQQIPAPDAYGDPQACAAGIKVMKAAADKGEVGDNGLTPKETAALLNMARACADSDVGGGIAEARTLYNAAVDTEAELKAAEKAYADDDSARNLEKRDDAQEAHDEAVEARNAHSGGGTIYESVFIEEDRLAKAKAASRAFTKAEAAADTALALRDAVMYEDYINKFAGFDSTGAPLEYETYTVVTTADTDATDDMDDAVYTTYVRVKKQGGGYVAPVLTDPDDDASTLIVPDSLDDTRAYDPDGTVETSDTNFEVVTIDHDLDMETEEISFVALSSNADALVDEVMFRTKDGNGMDTGGIEVDYKAAKDGLDAATKAVADNQDLEMDVPLAEAERKAQATYDFFAAQKASAEKDLAAGKLKVDRLGDNPGSDPVETNHPLPDTPYTVEDYEALTDLQDAETDAADALKAAYDARVAATNDVEANQRDTEAYLEQLVVLRTAEKAAADAAATKAEAEEETAGQKAANKKLATAEAQLASYNAIQALDDANPVKALVEGLLATGDEDDDGQTLVDAIDATYQTANEAMTLVEGLGGADGLVAQNTAKNVEQDMKLMQKKEYIDNLAAEIGVDPVTGDGTEANGMSRIDNNETRSMANEAEIGMDENGMSRIDHNEYRSMANAAEIAVGDDGMSRIDHNETRSMGNEGAIEMLGGRVGVNETAISGLGTRVGANEANITDNRNRIGELSEALDIVRSGVAASMALAGMPAINGRGIAIGVGSFDGESAFAVGFQIQGEMASFQIGVTSSGGETGASAGVGFQF